MTLAQIRKDLLESELGVPVGSGFYFERTPLPCRYLNDEKFQVELNGKWLDAESIDWEFDNSKFISLYV